MVTPVPLSIVVPAYNAASTLEETLNSLLAQTHREWEAIVVDDGSTDATVDIALSFVGRDPRFRLIHTDRAKVSAARNAGIFEATGRWILFLDSDDWLAPDHVEKLLAKLQENPEALAAYCAYERITADGASLQRHCIPEIEASPFETFARFCAAAIHSVIVDRQLIVRLGGFDPSLATCEDWDLWQRVARTGAKFVGVPETLAFYRIGPSTLSRNARQLAKDGLVVMRRGFGVDPRVQNPAPAYACGAQSGLQGEATALATFLVWCTAVEAGAGREGVSLLDIIDQVPDLVDDTKNLVFSILDGMTYGAGLPVGRLAEVWPKVEPPLLQVLDRLESASSQARFARRLRYAIEREILDKNERTTSVVLTLMMGATVDIRDLKSIRPPEGVDLVRVRILAGSELVTNLDLPAFGTLCPQDIARAAIDDLGLRHYLWRARARRRSSYWLRYSAQAGRLLAREAALRVRGGKQAFDLRGALRTAKTRAAVAGPKADPNGSTAVLQRLIDSIRPSDVTPGSIPEKAGRPTPKGDRRADWEEIFEKPDPWNYEHSDYERLKYDRTFALLPSEPIGKALELACAEGLFTKSLSGRVGHLTATDISKQALERAKERCAGCGNIEFACLDLAEDRLPSDLDLIVCSEVLYFLASHEQLRGVAAKIRDALAPGGRFLHAHAFVLRDDLSRTAFDWDFQFGAEGIHRAFSEASGMVLERSLVTDLYRIDLFRRLRDGEIAPEPVVEKASLDCELEPEVEKFVVWGGAEARRTDLIESMCLDSFPVLMYHRVAEAGPSSLSRYRVSPAMLDEQMRWLRRRGYYGITSVELDAYRRWGRPIPGRPVVVTFDDGYRDFHDFAWPILRRYDFMPEVFIVTDRVGGMSDWDSKFGDPAPLMTWDEIRRLKGEGVRFGSHLATHTPADGLTSVETVHEAIGSRVTLEAQLGDPVMSISQPYGIFDERLNRLLPVCGYRVGFSTMPGFARLTDHPYTLPRIDVSGEWTIDQFAAALDPS